MNLQKITIHSVMPPRNSRLAGTTGYIVNMLLNKETGLPVYMVRTPEGTIAPVSQDFEDFTIWGRCGNCDEEVDVRTLTDDYYEECLVCVKWFESRMGVSQVAQASKKQDKWTADLAKVAMANSRKGKPFYG